MIVRIMTENQYRLTDEDAAALDRMLGADRDAYDVVVLDRDLPGMHGDVVCAALIEAGCRSRVLMLTAAATAYLPARNARHHNLALMDLGATICTARMPYCPACPLQGDCAYRAAGCPAPSPRRARTPRFESTARYARGRIIDALRTGPQTADALAALLPEAHRESLPRYLAALQRDGLITHSEGAWHLPK